MPGERSTNRDLALATLGEIAGCAIDLSRFTDDAHWWWNRGLSYPIAEFVALLRDLSAATTTGVVVTPGLVLEDGERVVIEATSRADLADGRRYENRYLFVFHFADGRIREVREYSDTAHVAEIFDLG